MDPNATLRMIQEFIAVGRTGNAVDEWCHSLYQWIARGGFEPEWSRYPLGTSYYRCRAVSEPLPDGALDSDTDDYTIDDVWLCDDGTMDTVVEYECKECGETHELRYCDTSEYRHPDSGAFTPRGWRGFVRDVVLADINEWTCEGRSDAID